MIIHVVDISSPNFRDHIITVEKILKDLEVDEKPVMLVFNKVDLIDNPPLLRELSDEYPESIFIAAGRGIRMNRFTERLSEFVERHFSERTIAFVHKDFELANYIHEHGYVLFVHYEDEKAIFRFKMENSKLNKLLNDERVEELPLDYTFPGE
jgi:GTP-binding protein HflX